MATWIGNSQPHGVQIKGSVQDSVCTPEIDMKHMKKAEEYTNKDEFNSLNILSNIKIHLRN